MLSAIKDSLKNNNVKILEDSIENIAGSMVSLLINQMNNEKNKEEFDSYLIIFNYKIKCNLKDKPNIIKLIKQVYLDAVVDLSKESLKEFLDLVKIICYVSHDILIAIEEISELSECPEYKALVFEDLLIEYYSDLIDNDSMVKALLEINYNKSENGKYLIFINNTVVYYQVLEFDHIINDLIAYKLTSEDLHVRVTKKGYNILSHENFKDKTMQDIMDYIDKNNIPFALNTSEVDSVYRYIMIGHHYIKVISIERSNKIFLDNANKIKQHISDKLKNGDKQGMYLKNNLHIMWKDVTPLKLKAHTIGKNVVVVDEEYESYIMRKLIKSAYKNHDSSFDVQELELSIYKLFTSGKYVIPVGFTD